MIMIDMDDIFGVCCFLWWWGVVVILLFVGVLLFVVIVDFYGLYCWVDCFGFNCIKFVLECLQVEIKLSYVWVLQFEIVLLGNLCVEIGLDF